VNECTRIEQAMGESEQRLRAVVDTQLDAFAIYSAVRDSAERVVDVRTEFINRAACELSQIAAEDQLGRGLLELSPEMASNRIFELYREVIETGESFSQDGLELTALFGGVDGPHYYDVRIARHGDGLVVSCRDVTSRVLAEWRAERFTRIYATLSKADDAIVRIRQRRPLFEQVCRVLVEQGRLRMAWVGEIDDHGWIVPVAHSGAAQGYLDSIRISVLDVPEGRGPTGTAARERHHVFTTDITTDEQIAPWRDAALALEYRSSAGFPLMVEDRCVAVLTAYASEPGFFDEEEVKLFDGLAANLSFALEAMQRDERRRAVEAQLRGSEERFRAAVGSLLDSFTIVSPVRDDRGEIVDFRYEYVNEAHCVLVGFDREQLLGHRLGELFPQYPGSDRFAVYVRVAVTGEPCRSDEVHHEQAWAGTPLATRVVDTMIASMGENLVVSARDVTERRWNEQELQLRAELLDLAHDAVIVRDPAESRVRFWNREAQAIYGYSPAEALGEVTHELLATVFPESREAVDAALARDGRWVGELRHTRKDGRVIVVSSRQALQRGADGRPIAIIGVNSDITERKRAEEELAHVTGLLERTQEISKTGGWEYDVATGKLTWTDEVYRMYGVERTSDPELMQAIAAFDPESAPMIDAAFKRLVAEGEPYDLELGLVRADGQRIWVRTIGRPVIEGGRVVRVGGNIADVSDRKRAEEEIRKLNVELEQRVAARTAELERVNRELETFAYSVSHDLRAPLRAVDGFSQALLEDYSETLGEKGRHDLERVRAGAVRMGKLVDETLELSRLSRRRVVRAPVDVSALASEVVAELRVGEPDRRVAVEIQEGLLAEADAGLVRLVLQNLLANAYKFTSKTSRPWIRFGAVEQDGVPVYFVADNGAGFEMVHAKRLFLPFRRLHRESEFPGDGIGLATVMRVVRKHDGTIWAQGAVNRGATFHFSLTPGARPPASAATGEDLIPTWQPTEGDEG
jgi:PAS domain S-box-containing protein